MTLLERFQSTTDDAGQGYLRRTIPADVAAGTSVTATVTGPFGTADICCCVPVQYVDPDILADGFEAGETGAWSDTGP